MSIIYVYGDSILKGVVYRPETDKYGLCSKTLDDVLAEDDHECVLRTRFGCTIDKGYELFQRDLAKERKMDYVLLEYGGNDCDFSWDQVADAPFAEHQPNTPARKFRETAEKWLNELKQLRIKPILMTLPPIDSVRYFQTICRIYKLKREPLMHYLKVLETIGRFQSYYSDLIKDVAYRMRVPLLDLRQVYLDQACACDQLIGPDGIHPSEEGHRLIHQQIRRFLTRIMRKTRSLESLAM